MFKGAVKDVELYEWLVGVNEGLMRSGWLGEV